MKWCLTQGTDESLVKWVASKGSGNIAGADPALIGAQDWLDWDKAFEEGGVEFLPIENLIDKVWTEDNGRPEPQYKVIDT